MRPDLTGPEPVHIELGFEHGRTDLDDAPAGPARSRRSATVGMLLAVLICVGASAAPAQPALRELLTVPIGSADTFALTETGLLLVHSSSGGRLAAYGLADGRARWQASTSGSAYRMRSAGGLVLLRSRTFGEPDSRTVALAAQSGVTRWRHAGTVVSVAGSPTVLAVSEMRGLVGTGRRVQGPIVGVDADTGATRWSVPVTSPAVLQDLPGKPARALLLHESGAAEVRDLATGALLAAAFFPPVDYGPGNLATGPAVILLRHPGPRGDAVTGYDPATLHRRWTRSVGTAYEVRACGHLVCVAGPNGVRAVDPQDGTDRWSVPGWRTVEQRGDLVLAYSPAPRAGDLTGLVDVTIGRIVVDLRSWRAVPGQNAGSRLLVTRDSAAGARTVVGLAEPALPLPRVLGELPPGTGDCHALQGRLVCRAVSGRLVLWSYPDGGEGGH